MFSEFLVFLSANRGAYNWFLGLLIVLEIFSCGIFEFCSVLLGFYVLGGAYYKGREYDGCSGDYRAFL